jgi:hypothetical protein
MTTTIRRVNASHFERRENADGTITYFVPGHEPDTVATLDDDRLINLRIDPEQEVHIDILAPDDLRVIAWQISENEREPGLFPEVVLIPQGNGRARAMTNDTNFAEWLEANPPPDLQALVNKFGGYGRIPGWAFTEFDRQMAEWRELRSARVGE